jgi:hypothetical protein
MQPGQGQQPPPGQGRQLQRGQGQQERRGQQQPGGGCACTLFAVVDANGSLQRGFRAVSAQRFSTGQYEVVFNHNVSRCAYVAAIGDSGNNTIPPPGEIVVVGRFGDEDAVFIATYDSNGNPRDRGFHLAVSCRPNG